MILNLPENLAYAQRGRWSSGGSDAGSVERRALSVIDAGSGKKRVYIAWNFAILQ